MIFLIAIEPLRQVVNIGTEALIFVRKTIFHLSHFSWFLQHLLYKKLFR